LIGLVAAIVFMGASPTTMDFNCFIIVEVLHWLIKFDRADKAIWLDGQNGASHTLQHCFGGVADDFD